MRNPNRENSLNSSIDTINLNPIISIIYKNKNKKQLFFKERNKKTTKVSIISILVYLKASFAKTYVLFLKIVHSNYNCTLFFKSNKSIKIQ